MGSRTPAEIFPPGEFIAEELEARGWSQIELAEIMDRPPKLISQLISGKSAVTPETAKGLGAAFGTGAEFWMNLERDYRLSHAVHDDAAVERRARLYEMAPVKEMVNRGWMESSENIDVLEKRVFDLLKISRADERPKLPHAAKKTAYSEVTTAEWAWIFRTIKVAEGISVVPYSRKKLEDSLPLLESLLVSPEEARHVPRILSECGVRLVFVEKITKALIDGVCCWLDDSSPVIGMSLRKDRIDNFWFVLRHEIEHVLHGDGKEGLIIDSDLDGSGEDNTGLLSLEEQRANVAAANFCIPTERMLSFMSRKHPFYYEKDVVAFAHTIARHPGLVIGQLQFRINDFKYLAKKMALYKTRQFVIPGAIVDGWGQAARLDG